MPSASLEIHLRSDATRLTGESATILAHVLSDSLVWGMGFTQAIEARWPECAASMSHHRYQNRSRNVLGEVLWTQLTPNITLAHLVAERSRGGVSSNLDQDALALCLDAVAWRALASNATVHAPPIGTGLAGARWSEVEPLVRARLVERGIAVVIHCIGSQMPP